MFPPRPENIRKLTEASIDGTLDMLALPSPLAQAIVRRVIAAPSRRFAEIADEYDQRIPVQGIQQATGWFVRHFIAGFSVEGQENVPAEGPLLIVVNHAGGIDFLTVLASIPRCDLRLVANVHRTLLAVSNATPHFIYIGSHPQDRLAALVSAVNALRRGETVMIFPSGLLEPDPALIPGAQENMHKAWSPSLGVLLERAPATRLLPVLVGGVVSPQAYDSVLARLRPTTKLRQKTALLLQYMAQFNRSSRWQVDVRVTIGEPCSVEQLGVTGSPRTWIHAILEKQRALMARVYPQSSRPLLNWE